MLLCAALLVGGCYGGSDDDEDADLTPAPTSSQTDDDDDDTLADPATPAQPAPVNVNLTGNWSRLNAIYRLRQSGASIQGDYFDTVDPTIRGKIAGSVSGNNAGLTIVVTDSDEPTEGFTARKSVVIRSQNHLTMTVVSSPKFQGQVQEWYRIVQ
jgi:hypothetical protein